MTVFIFISFIDLHAQVEYKVGTREESIVPMGLGRSRIVSGNKEKDYKETITKLPITIQEKNLIEEKFE